MIHRQNSLVTEFFENPFIELRNLDRFVAEKARPIVRQFGLKPPDAIHVATAILMKVDLLHTFGKGDLSDTPAIFSRATL